MNIIKFRDIILDESNNTYSLSEDKVELFNNKLRGRYAYAVNFVHIIPLEDITQKQYYEISVDESKLDGITYIELIDVKDFIDIEETEKSNSVVNFIEANKFTLDDDITLDEIKRFRTWLAETLLSILVEPEEQTKEMLEYYANEMYDDTIKHLTHFTQYGDAPTVINFSSCNCATNKNLVTQNQGALYNCDPIAVYRKGVYDKMVDVFSSIDFWKNLSTDFLTEFKKYIDGIIKLNLPLYTSPYVSDLFDCSCLSDHNSLQIKMIGYLQNLSTALGYLKEGDLYSHKNMISDSLLKWSSYLYEKMRWV
jgi:hypothetical protein